MSLDLLSAFIIGLLGSGHCLVMCGGITTMLTSAIEKPQSFGSAKISNHGDIPVTEPATINGDLPQSATSTKPINRSSIVFLYHLGRITSYSLIGAIVGFTGSIAAKNLGMPIAGMRLIAAVFIILLGLYIGKWLLWLNRVESLGKGLWAYLSPMSKHVIPVNNRTKALGLGALWGWLPCGLVYSTLTWALASGDSLTGASIMLFFGLGTLPSLLTVSFGLLTINKLLVQPVFRQIVALTLISYGFYSFIVAYQVVF